LKVLLDEGVPEILRKRLPLFVVRSVQEVGWRGVRNGALLDLMTGQFTVLITTDKNLRFQQNLAKRQISAIALPTNDIPSVLELLPQIEIALQTIAPGEFVQL